MAAVRLTAIIPTAPLGTFPERLEQALNRSPCRPIQYQSPDHLTPALFSRAG